VRAKEMAEEYISREPAAILVLPGHRKYVNKSNMLELLDKKKGDY